MAYDRFIMDRRAKRLRESMEMAMKNYPIEIITDTEWHVWPDGVEFSTGPYRAKAAMRSELDGKSDPETH